MCRTAMLQACTSGIGCATAACTATHVVTQPATASGNAPFTAEAKSYSLAEGQRVNYVTVPDHQPAERALVGVTVVIDA